MRLSQLALTAALGALAAPAGAAPLDHALLISDPEALQAAEAGPLAFAARFGDAGSPAPTAAALHRASARYRSLTADLAADLAALAAADPRLGPTMATAHRLFDKRWLDSPAAGYELVAVAQRLDRQPFHPGACGEARLVYRLRYEKTHRGQLLMSRLPLTINAVYHQLDDQGGGTGCRAVAARWVALRGLSGAALAKALVADDGPLSAAALAPARLKSIELNVQSVRWPSTVRPDLGGHAEYLLRVYHVAGPRLVRAPLENTPDVRALLADAARRKELLAWIQRPDTLAAIDAGTALVPDRFLAKESTSVSPRGLERLANRPFSRLFTPRDLSGVEGSLAGYATIKSPAALLRRLDDLSCAGCHQGRSVAGFHALGVDRAGTPAANAIAVTGSPHLTLDLPRRRAYLEALLAGKTPDPTRPASERAREGEGGYGSHCGLGDPGFAAWTCASGLVCKSVGGVAGDDGVGQCLPAAGGRVGDPCEPGTMRPHPDPRRDKLVAAGGAEACARGVCETTPVGFPNGMCAVSCGDDSPDVACGSIAILHGFNTCLGHGKPFTECLERNVRPAGLRACDEAKPCRDDYLCARAAGASGAGACIPPYFLFQMRVDGHPPP